jgi:hypothetical protein
MSEHGNCVKHLFERATHYCDQCGHPYCDECVIQPFKNRPPLCKACAMAAAGIRSTARVQPARSRKEIKELQASLRQSKEEAESEGRARFGRKKEPEPGPPRILPSAMMSGEPDVVPPMLGSTPSPPPTKRLWRTTG